MARVVYEGRQTPEKSQTTVSLSFQLSFDLLAFQLSFDHKEITTPSTYLHSYFDS